MAEITGFRLKEVLIRDLLKPKLLKALEKEKLKIRPISLVFIEVVKTGKKNLEVKPVIFTHSSDTDVNEKILRVQGDPTLLTKTMKALKSIGAK